MSTHLYNIRADSQVVLLDILAFVCHNSGMNTLKDLSENILTPHTSAGAKTSQINMLRVPTSANINSAATTSKKNLSDSELYCLCKSYGSRVLEARRKFVGLLPEVNSRRLFEKKKFISIFHFAAVLAGISKEQVSRALSLAEKFAQMPTLLSLLTNGIVSVNKLAKIASIATIEEDSYWATQVQLLSTRTIETLVRDIILSSKLGVEISPQNANSTNGDDTLDGLFEPRNGSNFVHVNKLNNANFEQKYQIGQMSEKENNFDHGDMNSPLMLATATSQPLINHIAAPILCDEVKKKLNELQSKNINIDDIILNALAQREEQIAGEKSKLAEKAQNKLVEQFTEEKIISRTIPVATKRLLSQEFGTKCAVDFCKNKSSEIHHTARFSVAKTHNPYYLAPLCKAHHQLAHAADVMVSHARAAHHQLAHAADVKAVDSRAH